MTPHTKPHVLIADDNATLARVIEFNLGEAGCQTTTVNDGREAWEVLQNRNFDAVITDYQMPGLTGTELCRRLRQQPKYEHLPIILLTAKGLELNLGLLRDELQITAIFAKPFSPQELVRELQASLERLDENEPKQAGV